MIEVECSNDRKSFDGIYISLEKMNEFAGNGSEIRESSIIRSEKSLDKFNNEGENKPKRHLS